MPTTQPITITIAAEDILIATAILDAAATKHPHLKPIANRIAEAATSAWHQQHPTKPDTLTS